MTTTDNNSPSTTEPETVHTNCLGLDVLMAQIETLEPSVLNQPAINQAEVAARKPGGAKNSDPSINGWLQYFKYLCITFGRGPQQPSHTEMRWDGQSMEDLRTSLAEEPLYFKFENGEQTAVFPKSATAIMRVLMIDRAMQMLAPDILSLEMLEPTPQTEFALRRAMQVREYLDREFLWIVTHPGNGLPWEDDGKWEHELPDTHRDYTTYDILAARKAYLDVNLMRINSVAARTHTAGSDTGGALPFAAFMSLMADDMHISTAEIMNRWSVGAVYARACIKSKVLDDQKRKDEANRN